MSKQIHDYLNKRLKVVYVGKRNSILKKISKSDMFINVNQPNYVVPIKRLIKGEIGSIYNFRIIVI